MNPERILETLEQVGGYRRVAQPLHIADVDFDFAGALVGPDDQQALTLVLDENQNTIAAAIRRLKAFSVVLERTGSTRPISVILLSKKPDPSSIAALEQVSRVIVVQPDQEPNDALYSLLPLELPKPIPPSESAEKTLREELQSNPMALTQRLLRAAKKSATAVEEQMRGSLINVVNPEK